jgi:hypothetical protein
VGINLMKPPFVVDAGPCPGVYLSEEAYKDHLKRSGIQHPLEGGNMELVQLITWRPTCPDCGRPWPMCECDD